jgi:predicted DNA-binding transcriptional regulator AlpA
MQSPTERMLGSILCQIGGGRGFYKLDPVQHPKLLTIAEVETRTKMKRSNIYRLIELGQFPAPIHLGGARWRADEVEEFIQRRTEERDRERGGNNFVPRSAILSGSITSGQNGALSRGKTEITPSQQPSTVRMLGLELCEALRILKVDIPELYLDTAAFNVFLAVVKVELPSVPPANSGSKGKKR